MDIRQLRYFITIAEAGSISAASQRLNVAQPALSLHVRNMEDHLGSRLLVRGARGVSLTEAGELLLSRARVLLTEFSRIEDDIRNLGATPKGVVRLGLPGTIGSILSLELVLAARERFPGVHLTVAEAMSGFVLDWLYEGRVDVAVLYLPAEDARFRSDLLLREELVLLSPPGVPLRRRVVAGDLADLPLILPSPAHGLRKLLDGWALRQGVSLRAEMELDSYQNIKELVERGQGASILPLHAVKQESEAGRIAIAAFADGCHRDVHLVRPQAEMSSHACEAVAGLISQIAAGLVRDGRWAGAEATGC